jgi:hypothetical protein
MSDNIKTPKPDFLAVQPASCRVPLVRKPIEWAEWALKPENDKWRAKVERVLWFDPTELYARIAPLLNPYKRHQGLAVATMFPKREDGRCAC